MRRLDAAQRLPNIHPGEVLEKEFPKPMAISRYRLAKDIGVPPTRIAEICHAQRSISPDTAPRLAKYFGNTAKSWMGLQEDYDLEEAAKTAAKALADIRPVPMKAAG